MPKHFEIYNVGGVPSVLCIDNLPGNPSSSDTVASGGSGSGNLFTFLYHSKLRVSERLRVATLDIGENIDFIWSKLKRSVLLSNSTCIAVTQDG